MPSSDVLLPLPSTMALASNTTTAASSRRPSTTMLCSQNSLEVDQETRRPSLAFSTTSNTTLTSCHSRVDRISSISHVVRALQLTWGNKKADLFTAWIHVPVGITSLLVFVWVINIGMDKAPFNFPSPVLAMVALLALLLSLDYLSTRSCVQARLSRSSSKPLLAPFLAALEPPCDFCLRYMSVMFTPSFILIPARELIGGKEIGILTGWFAATQLVALVFPVFLHRAIQAVKRLVVRRLETRREQAAKKAAARRASVATIVSITDNVQGGSGATEKDSAALDAEKLYDGVKLGKIAQGLSGVTAIATAPLVITRNYSSVTEAQTQLLKDQEVTDQDQQRHIMRVQMETARQQGDPYVTSPRADVLTDPMHAFPLTSSGDYDGMRPHHFFASHRHLSHNGSAQRSRSASRPRPTSSSSSKAVRPSPRRPSSAGTPGVTGKGDNIGSHLRQSSTGGLRRPASSGHRAGRSALRNQFISNRAISPTRPKAAALAPVFNQAIFDMPTTAKITASELRLSPEEQGPDLDCRANRLGRDGTRNAPQEQALPCVMFLPKEEENSTQREPFSTPSGADNAAGPNATMKDQDVEAQPDALVPSSEGDSDAPDAVERLSERFADAITPTVYALVFIVGLPVFYLTDVSLPLFLGVNMLTFLASITIVPPQIRRYAHPILTTSVATVLILWGLGEARGWRIKQTLASYSVDAKYTQLWALSGYNGPIVGAGDILFSTLDAGIVSLAIPMYRYRRDLYQRFTDMLMVLFPCALLSLFAWPSIAYLIGIAPERALAFASRFMSTPLAIELSLTIGADESITVILVVITGILISVFKDPFFRLLKVDSNDSLTIGIAMGSTAGAIGASSLISKPRTMAIASLSFVLFGAILLIFAAIPSVVEIVRTLAGASIAL